MSNQGVRSTETGLGSTSQEEMERGRGVVACSKGWEPADETNLKAE